MNKSSKELIKLQIIQQVNAKKSFFVDCLSIKNIKKFALDELYFECSEHNFYFSIQWDNKKCEYAVRFFEKEQLPDVVPYCDISDENSVSEIRKYVEQISYVDNEILFIIHRVKAIQDKDALIKWVGVRHEALYKLSNLHDVNQDDYLCFREKMEQCQLYSSQLYVPVKHENIHVDRIMNRVNSMNVSHKYRTLSKENYLEIVGDSPNLSKLLNWVTPVKKRIF